MVDRRAPRLAGRHELAPALGARAPGREVKRTPPVVTQTTRPHVEP